RMRIATNRSACALYAPRHGPPDGRIIGVVLQRIQRFTTLFDAVAAIPAAGGMGLGVQRREFTIGLALFEEIERGLDLGEIDRMLVRREIVVPPLQGQQTLDNDLV